MGEFAIGQSVPRTEDPRLLRGRGWFVDDISLTDMLVPTVCQNASPSCDAAPYFRGVESAVSDENSACAIAVASLFQHGTITT